VLLGLGAHRTLDLRSAVVGRTAAAVLTVLGIVNLGAVLPAYREFERLIFTPAAHEPPPEAAFREAITRLYGEPLLVPYLDLVLAHGVTPDPDHLSEKLALTSRAMHFVPGSVVVYRHALLLALAGEREIAQAQLESARRVYPNEAGAVAADLEPRARAQPGLYRPLLEWIEGKREAPPARTRPER
jgi:Virulence factor membrane-bound polymerase, C-terminal